MIFLTFIGRESLIYLDTHVVVWLQAGLIDRLSPTAVALINQHDLFVSPIVRLELQYLYEIGRITTDSDQVISDLGTRIGLQICLKPFNAIISTAKGINWTRDPFDRILVAHAALDQHELLTSDRVILEHFEGARWAK